MKIMTNRDIDPMGLGLWRVTARWRGRDARVFEGTLGECIHWYRSRHFGRLPA
jgi:hypothetical protein